MIKTTSFWLNTKSKVQKFKIIFFCFVYTILCVLDSRLMGEPHNWTHNLLILVGI